MITRPTVLVLGAGASYEYGYPVGSELRNKILKMPGASKQRVAGAAAKGSHSVDSFMRDFGNSALQSIDRFLYKRPEYAEIGKAAIADVLIPCEQLAKLHGGETLGPHLYQYLWNALQSGSGDLTDNKLSIVTFNYDRSLEQFLYLAVKGTYGLDDDGCRALVASIPLVHVHGVLGGLPWQKTDGYEREYGDNVTEEHVRRSSEMLKIVHEDLTYRTAIEQAWEILDASPRIIFLGFGYLEENLKRIGIQKYRTEIGKMYGSGCFMTEQERVQITDTWGINVDRARIAHGSCLEYLRNVLPLP